MATIANPFELGKVADLSGSINIVPNTWGMIQQMGLFTNEYKTQKVVLVPRNQQSETVITDRNWNERNNTIKGVDRDVLAVQIPHFPVDDAIYGDDLDGQADWDSILVGGNATLSLEKVRARKMEALRNAHSLTLEVARAQMIRDGSVYAPNGTVITNFYTEFGLTRDVIPLGLASTTVNPLAAVKAAYGEVQDSVLNGAIVSNIVALASPEFFAALVSNPFVTESYQYFAQSQGAGILNQRLSSGGFDDRYETFKYGGITFIEARGSANGVPYVNAGEAYVFPLGTDSFRTYFAPAADRLQYVNKTAQESYYFEYLNRKDDIIEIMSETNFANALLRPQIVKTLTIGE